ncbi:helix-turn-helix domain-containing protein [Bacillus mycoides]|uniref:helix-turn-helix domain-containing protein n=1 Tax=Bacillus mycoides TaxID=1405 RepID=UPI001F34CF4E|nr:helix-turn-helix domain-containing protein [Bacillus mycoides]
MTNLIKEVQLDEQVQRQLKSTNSLLYVKVLKLADEISQMQQNLYKELNEAEKNEVKVVMSKTELNNNPKHLTTQDVAKVEEVYEMPEYLTTQDVAKMLHMSTQMVRRYCASGEIKATQRMGGTGAWLIETSQYLEHPGLRSVLAAKEEKRQKSLGIAKSMLDLIND